jgi:hypothetical protein
LVQTNAIHRWLLKEKRIQGNEKGTYEHVQQVAEEELIVKRLEIKRFLT